MSDPGSVPSFDEHHLDSEEHTVAKSNFRSPRKLRAFVSRGAWRSNAQLAVGQAFSLFGIFVAGLIVARQFGPQSYGRYAAAFALSSLTVGGATVGIPTLVLRRSSEGNLDHKVLRRALWILIGFCAIALLGTAGISVLALGGLKGMYASLAAWLFFSANSISSLGQYVHAGRQNYSRAALTNVVAGFLFPVFTYTALKFHSGVDGALLAIALASAASSGIAWTRLPLLESDHESPPLKVRESISFSFLGLVNAGYGRIDTVVLSIVAGSSAAGYYAASYRLLGPFDLLGLSFGIYYFSRVSAHNTDIERWSAVRTKGVRAFIAVSFIGVAILLFITPQVIRLFYGPNFNQSIGTARILMLSVIPWSLYWLKRFDLASVHRESWAAYAVGFGLLLDFFLVLVFGRYFGPDGAAWSWVISESAMYVTLWFMCRRITENIGN